MRLVGVQLARPSSEESNSRAGVGSGDDEDTVEQTAGDVDRAAAGEILREVLALREDISDLSEIFAAGRRSAPVTENPKRADSKPEEAEALIRRADALSRDSGDERPETPREILLREVDALRQAIAAVQESGVLAVILPKPKFQGFGSGKRKRLERRAFG